MTNHLRADPTSTLLGKRAPSYRTVWHSQIDRHKFKVLSQHYFRGKPLLPASAYLDIVYSAAREIKGLDHCALGTSEITEGLFLPNDEVSIQFMTEYDCSNQGLKVFSRVSTSPENWRLNFSTKIGAPRALDGNELWCRAREIISNNKGYFPGALVYYFAGLGQLSHGHVLQLVKEGWALPDEVVARIVVGDEDQYTRHSLNPALIDACLQTGTINRICQFGVDATHFSFIPVRIGRLQIRRPIRHEDLIVYFRKRADTIRYSISDIFIFSDNGDLLIQMDGFESYGSELEGDNAYNSFDHFTHEIIWRPVFTHMR